jgi:hypothetical protein
MGVTFVSKTGLGRIAISFATKTHPTTAAVKMEGEAVSQAGSNRIALNFAI